MKNLFGEIVIPQSVYDEVADESKSGSKLIKAAKYLKVKKVIDSKGVDLLLGYLGKGEAEALTLSKEIKADFILIDEKKARKVARRAGFEVIGVLGLLLAAKNKALIPEIRPFIEELSNQGFRLSERVTEKALRKAEER